MFGVPLLLLHTIEIYPREIPFRGGNPHLVGGRCINHRVSISMHTSISEQDRLRYITQKSMHMVIYLSRTVNSSRWHTGHLVLHLRALEALDRHFGDVITSEIRVQKRGKIELVLACNASHNLCLKQGTLWSNRHITAQASTNSSAPEILQHHIPVFSHLSSCTSESLLRTKDMTRRNGKSHILRVASLCKRDPNR